MLVTCTEHACQLCSCLLQLFCRLVSLQEFGVSPGRGMLKVLSMHADGAFLHLLASAPALEFTLMWSH